MKLLEIKRDDEDELLDRSRLAIAEMIRYVTMKQLALGNLSEARKGRLLSREFAAMKARLRLIDVFHVLSRRARWASFMPFASGRVRRGLVRTKQLLARATARQNELGKAAR